LIDVLLDRSQHPNQFSWQCFDFLTELWNKDIESQEQMKKLGLVTCIHLQLSFESARISRMSNPGNIGMAANTPPAINILSPVPSEAPQGLTGADDYQLTASRYAAALLCALPPQEQTACDLVTEDILSTIASLFWLLHIFYVIPMI
jgi:hypothetical protein